MNVFNNRSLAEEEVDKIIKEVDHNRSGSIDFTGNFRSFPIKYRF